MPGSVQYHGLNEASAFLKIIKLPKIAARRDTSLTVVYTLNVLACKKGPCHEKRPNLVTNSRAPQRNSVCWYR
jgi:hypothetical protein